MLKPRVVAVAEEAFDLPAFPVSLDGLLGGGAGGDDQEIAVGEALGREEEREAQALVQGGQARRLALCAGA